MHLALDKEHLSFSESDTMTRKDSLFSPQSFPQKYPSSRKRCSHTMPNYFGQSLNYLGF